MFRALVRRLPLAFTAALWSPRAEAALIVGQHIPTPDELAVIGLTLPSYMTLSSEGERVLFTLHAPDQGPPYPLMTWYFAPGSASSFAGDTLSRAIEHLAGVLRTILREMQSKGGPDLGDIVACGSGVVFAVRRAVLQSQELKVDVADVHRVEPADWSWLGVRTRVPARDARPEGARRGLRAWVLRRVRSLPVRVALVGCSLAACGPEREQVSSAAATVSNRKIPAGEPAQLRPRYGPALGGDGIARDHGGSPAGVSDLPRPALASHFPLGRPAELIDAWREDTCYRTGTNEPVACVVHCTTSVWADLQVTDFGALTEAAAALGFERHASQSGALEFVDADDVLGKPLIVAPVELTHHALPPGSVSGVEVSVCRSVDEPAVSELLAEVVDGDWRFAPSRSLGRALEVRPFAILYGRRGEEVVAEARFWFKAPSPAMAAWADAHGLVRGPTGTFVASGEGYALELSGAGTATEALRRLSVTTPWPK